MARPWPWRWPRRPPPRRSRPPARRWRRAGRRPRRAPRPPGRAGRGSSSVPSAPATRAPASDHGQRQRALQPLERRRDAAQDGRPRAVDRGEDDEHDLARLACAAPPRPAWPGRDRAGARRGRARRRATRAPAATISPAERMVDAEHGADHAGHRAQRLPRRPPRPHPPRLDARRAPRAAQPPQQRERGAALGVRAGEGAAVHGGGTLVFARAMDATDLCFAGAAEQARLVAAGEVSARELVEASLERIWQADPELNAFRVVLAAPRADRGRPGRRAPRGGRSPAAARRAGGDQGRHRRRRRGHRLRLARARRPAPATTPTSCARCARRARSSSARRTCPS